MAKKTQKTNKKQENKIEKVKEKRIGTRGKIFEGKVIKKFPKRVVISFERMVYFKKYERFAQLTVKIHARLPEELEKKVNLGDFVRIQECRPLSKIVHFIVIDKLKSGNENESN